MPVPGPFHEGDPGDAGAPAPFHEGEPAPEAPPPPFHEGPDQPGESTDEPGHGPGVNPDPFHE